MKRKISLILAILIIGLLCTTCDLLKEMVKAPEVTLKSVDFSNITFEGLTLLSKIDIQNDNSVTIPLPKIDWYLNIIDNPFTKGNIESEGPLKSRGATEVQFPVSFTYEDIINTFLALTDENARYKINMTAHIPVPQLGNMSWDFAHEGKVPLMRLPDIDIATPPKFSSTGTLLNPSGKIDFALNLKNKSNVAVIVKDLSCVLKIGNTSLPKGGVTGNPRINAGETEEILFSFSLTAADILAIGFNVLTGNNFTYDLTGNYMFGIPDFPLLNEIGDKFTLP